MKLAGAEIGPERPLFLIAGPCVVEDAALNVVVPTRRGSPAPGAPLVSDGPT